MAITTVKAIIERLVAQGVASTTGAATDIFESRMPPTPANAIAVRGLPGAKADRAFGVSTPVVREYPSVQLMLRRGTIAGMDTLTDAIRAALDFQKWTATDGNEFFTEFAHEPMDFGEDENENEVRSIVIKVSRTR